jgi:glycosyltransferase involved in cell wall biosynthesis
MSTCSTRITVAICTWNRSQTLRQTLEQLTEIRLPTGVEWELLIVNNCCTDDTDQVVDSYRGRLPIRLLHESRAGQSHARNLAVREATGSYIAWTDDDVLVDPNWLGTILQAFLRYEADWVFGRSEPKWLTVPPPWYSNRFRGHFALLDYGPEPFVVTECGHPFYGLNFAGTHDAHVRLSGFRTEFGLRGLGGGVGEDVDIFERALATGMRIVYTPDAVVQHMIPASRATKQHYRNRYWVSNEVVFRFLPDMFPNIPMLFGFPRFFFRKALDDMLRYARALVRHDRSAAFYYELELVRFARFAFESARHGFRAPRGHQPAEPTPNRS